MNKLNPKIANTQLCNLIDENPEYLIRSVDTSEAAKITGVPISTLVTFRSRGGGPLFLQPRNTRIVRYLVLHLMEWMLSGGIKSNTADFPAPITFPEPPIGPLANSVKSRTGE